MPVHPDEAVWMLRQLRHTKGRFAGTPFRMQGFQEEMVRDITALRGAPPLKDYLSALSKNPTTLFRRNIQEALIGMGRKGGKTELFAALGIIFLLLDREPGAEIIGAAAKRDQARILLNAARSMVMTSTINGRPLDQERGGFIKVHRDAIYYPALDAVFKVVSSDAQKEHGANPSVVLGDELHAWRDPELWYALTTGQGARDNPLAIAISTGGVTPSGLCYDLYRIGRQVEAGELPPEPGVYFRWYEGDPELDLWVPEQRELYLRQANPGYGTITSPEYLERQWNRVVAGKLPEYTFRRLHGNQWTTAMERWIPYGKWRRCAEQLADIPEGSEVVVAIDAALSRDSFGVATVTKDPQGHVHCKVRAFLPARDGEYIDPLDVLVYIVGLASLYKVKVVRADPAYLGLLASMLKDKGINVEMVNQGDVNMVRASETLQRVVLDGLLHTSDDPTLEAQIACTATRLTERGVRIVKRASGGRIDVVVALAMAIDGLLNPDEKDEGRDFAIYADLNDIDDAAWFDGGKDDAA
jgi:phage terminase large subunit-like protein